jgi:hypothetical protein
VEEDIPPNWEEILPSFSKTTLEQRPTTGTITPLIFLKPAETSCMVEEEIPPQMEDYCKNSVDVKDEDPKINWDDFCKEDDTHRKTMHKRACSPDDPGDKKILKNQSSHNRFKTSM